MDHRPASHRRRLRKDLRKVREAAGHTRDHVAQAMEWSLSKVVRIETGTVNISVSDLRSLLEFYGLGEAERQQLVRLCRLGRRRMWWDDLHEIEQPLRRYIALESEASRICQYEPLLVPGLLQTESYARAVITSIEVDESMQRVEAWLSIRLRRQREVLHRQNPAEIVAVMDEGALHRLVGGARVMRDQRRHLVRLARQRNVSIHVLPFEVGSYPAIDTPFTMLEFDGDELDDVLFFTGSSQAAFIEEDAEKIIWYRRTMERLRAIALNESESIELLIELAAS